MNNVIIGCDNGVSGALVVLSAFNGAYIAGIPMPIQKERVGKKWVNEVDCRKVIEWCEESAGQLANIKAVAIEMPIGSKSYSAAISMAGSFHALRTVFEYIHHPPLRIHAREWQTVMLGKQAKGDTKKAAIARAKELWPNELFLASKRCKTPHTGIVDAALLAEYARIKKL